jgi:hypothetical protein
VDWLGHAPTPLEERHAEAIAAHGILMPVQCVLACEATGLPVELGSALLMQETSGGRNEFGHDPTIFVGGGEVTEAAYNAYKVARDALLPGGPRRMQGVGPIQLTWYAFQDEADAEGGCWHPLTNMKVGFRHLAGNVQMHGLRGGIAAYNGTGPAAEHYADSVLALMQHFKPALA